MIDKSFGKRHLAPVDANTARWPDRRPDMKEKEPSMLRKSLIAAVALASTAALSPAAFAADEYNVSVGVAAAGAPRA